MNNIKYLPLSLFVLYSAKLLILGGSYVDAPLLLILGTVAAFYEFKSQDKKLAEMEQKLERINLLEKDHENLKTHVSGLKLGQTYNRNIVR